MYIYIQPTTILSGFPESFPGGERCSAYWILQHFMTSSVTLQHHIRICHCIRWCHFILPNQSRNISQLQLVILIFSEYNSSRPYLKSQQQARVIQRKAAKVLVMKTEKKDIKNPRWNINGKRAKNIDVNTGSYQNTMTVIEGKMIQGRKRTKDENFRTGDNMACVIKL